MYLHVRAAFSKYQLDLRMAKKSDSFKLAQNEGPQFDQTNYFFMQFCHQNTGFPHMFIACLHLPLARMYFVNVWLFY